MGFPQPWAMGRGGVCSPDSLTVSPPSRLTSPERGEPAEMPVPALEPEPAGCNEELQHGGDPKETPPAHEKSPPSKVPPEEPPLEKLLPDELPTTTQPPDEPDRKSTRLNSSHWW